MQAIIQAAIEDTRAAVKALTEAADLAKVCMERHTVGNQGSRQWTIFETVLIQLVSK